MLDLGSIRRASLQQLVKGANTFIEVLNMLIKGWKAGEKWLKRSQIFVLVVVVFKEFLQLR